VGGMVSNYMHDQLQVGVSLELFAPAGDFVLRESAKPLVLISAGVGITPALSMLEAARDSGREIHFIHCARHAGVHAFRDWVEAQRSERPHLRHYVCYSEPRAGDEADGEGFLSLEQLDQWLPEQRDLDAYFLGPKPFMAQVKRHLHSLGVPAAQSHYEFFGPASALDS
jgi:nitric oxide dioxygenase